MSCRRALFTGAVALSGSVLLALMRPLSAQSGYEAEVYGTDMVLPGTLLFELHTGYVLSGQQASSTGGGPTVFDDRTHFGIAEDPTCFDSTAPLFARSPLHGAAQSYQPSVAADVGCAGESTSSSHTTRALLEMSTGITTWLDAAFYLFGSNAPDAGTSFDGESYRLRIRTPASWRWPAGVGLSTELEHDRGVNASWTWEVRPIFDRAFGRWYASVNPVLDRVISGAGAGQGVNFSPSARASYDINQLVTLGAEYYGAFGEIGAFATPANRLQQFFGTVDLHRWATWEISAGVGVGTTSVSEHVVAKLVIGRRLSFARDTVTI